MDISPISGFKAAGPFVQVAVHGDDSQLYVEFYLDAVMYEDDSAREGHPVYKQHLFVKAYAPANSKTTILHDLGQYHSDKGMPGWFETHASTSNGFVELKEPRFVVTPKFIEYRDRFPRAWQSFQNQTAQVLDGLPVEQWPPLAKPDVAQLKAAQIHTVEQLAQLSDSTVQGAGILGLSKWRDMARAYLERSTNGSAVTAMQQELEKLRAEVAALTTRRGPGRPPKDEAA